MSDYKEKIRKLLALAGSPNEHEARAALLKARELMAENKLTDMDVKEAGEQPVERMLTDITCSKRRNPWIVPLSVAIGENYCCKAYRNRVKGKQICTVGFIGLQDDVEVCYVIFKYAVDCVLSEIRLIRKENSIYLGEHVTRFCDSYGYGFTKGVRKAFEKQKAEKEQEWGLVMVVPKAVEDAAKEMGYSKFKAHAQDCIHNGSFTRGYEDGTKFDPTKKLAGA